MKTEYEIDVTKVIKAKIEEDGLHKFVNDDMCDVANNAFTLGMMCGQIGVKSTISFPL